MKQKDIADLIWLLGNARLELALGNLKESNRLMGEMQQVLTNYDKPLTVKAFVKHNKKSPLWTSVAIEEIMKHIERSEK